MSIEEAPLSTDDCYRCGYDLRGIANDRACPECGLLAERSRRVSDELHNTRPRWLGKLSRGVWLMLLALVILLPSSILADQARYWLSTFKTFGNSWLLIFELTPLFGPGIAAGVFALGVLSFTAREQYAPADQLDRRRRVLLRILAMFPLLGVVGEGALVSWSFSHTVSYVVMDWSIFAVFSGALAASIPLPALLFYQLRSLAKRARSEHLAEHCAIVGIGMSSAVLYGMVMAIIFQFSERWALDPNWATRSSVSLGLMIVCTLSASLFALWSFYLLIRFAIAFHIAARQLNRKWKTDDRATAT